jgi:hypothetical protein
LSTKNTMHNCLGLNPASMVISYQLSASLPKPWHSLLVYQLLCECVQWLFNVTSHTVAVCACVTVQSTNKLCTHPIPHHPCEMPKQPYCCYIMTSDSIHKQLYRQWINWKHHYCHRTFKHKEFHYK